MGRQSQAWIRKNRAVTLSTGLKRRTCSLESQRKERRIAAGQPPGSDACNAPEAQCPQPWGQRVGGVSERPTRARKGEILSRARGRNGGRHPDLRDAGNLRGLPAERGSWSVRHVGSGARSSANGRTDDNRCPLGEEEGNVVSVREAHALDVETPNKRLYEAKANEDTSFTRSRDPCTSIGTSLRRRKPTEVSRSIRYRGRASSRKWEEPVRGVGLNGRMRGSPRVTALRMNPQRSCVMRQKRKVVMATVPARK